MKTYTSAHVIEQNKQQGFGLGDQRQKKQNRYLNNRLLSYLQDQGVWLSGRASALHVNLCAEGPGFDHPLLQLLFCESV